MTLTRLHPRRRISSLWHQVVPCRPPSSTHELCTSRATCQRDRPSVPRGCDSSSPPPPRRPSDLPPGSGSSSRSEGLDQAGRPDLPRGFPCALAVSGAWSRPLGSGRGLQGREAPYLSSRPYPPCTGPTSCRARNPTCSPPAARAFLKVGPRAPAPGGSRESRPRFPGPEGRRRPAGYREMT